MKAEYERGLYNNYMILKAEESINENYQLKMLRQGAEGILLLNIRYFDGTPEFCYDISAKQKLSDWFKTKKMNYKMLRGIIESLCNALETAVDYLLDVNHIILEPDYIFMDTEKYAVSLCYYPFYEKDIIESGQEFLQYLLEVLDYNDKGAVEAAYEIFRLCMKDSFNIEILRKFFSNEAENESIIENKVNLNMKDDKEDRLNDVWNKIVPVNVMNEEVEEECEKTWFPYINRSLRVKICMGISAAEAMFSLIFILSLKKNLIFIFAYIFVSMLLAAAALIVGIFYDRVRNITKIVSIKKQIDYNSGSRKEGYVYDSDFSDNSDEEASKYEETVLLAYSGKKEDLKRLHYVGTEDQEDVIITKYPFVVGKSEQETDYCLAYPFVSRLHFRLDREGDKYFITDTNSRNGLFINGISLNATETKELRNGDKIEIGELKFLFQ